MRSSRGPSKTGSGGATRRAPGGGATRAARAPATGGLALLERFDRGDFPATLYLEGPSEPLKAMLLAELRRAWARSVPEAPLARIFRAAESGVEEILGAFQGASLFSPRDLLIVLDVEDLGRSEKRIAALAAGLGRPGGGSTLALVESAAENERKTLAPLRAACAVRWVADPPARPELLAWGRRRLEREGVRAEAGVLEAVADACEGEALAFFSELDKLIAYAGADGTLARSEADTLLRPVLGADIPEYLGAVALGYPGLAAQRLGRLLAAGAGEGQVLFALTNLVGGALGGWARYREHSEALRRRLPPARLAHAMDALYRGEAAWKGGRADVVAVLEQATREVAGPAIP